VEAHTTETTERVIHELNLYLLVDGEERELPVMLVADTTGEAVRGLRIYHSTWPLTGKHAVRHPLMQYALPQRPPEPVGTYHEALGNADAETADSVFEPDGSVRELAGARGCTVDRTVPRGTG